MPETESGAATVGIVNQIAAALGYSPTIIEILIFAFLVILLLVGVFSILAIFRIRKEMISLNYKIIYIGRLIEQAVKKPEIPKAAPAEPKINKETQEPSGPKEVGDKFKL